MKNEITRIFILLFIFTSSLFSSDITHYGALNTVQDVVQTENSLIFATDGGLVEYDLATNSILDLENSEERLRDISLNSLYQDSDGILWAGSNQGYFYQRNSRGRWKTYEDFYAASAIPSKIIPYGDEYLLVAHTKGISVFSNEEERIVTTVTTPAMGGRVFDLLLIDDTLFAAVEKSVVRFDSLNDQIFTFNFEQPENWTIVDSTSILEVRGLLYENSGIVGYSRPVLMYENRVMYGKKSIESIDTSYVDDADTVIDETDTTFGELLFTETDGEITDSITLSSEVTSIYLMNDGKPVVTTSENYAVRDPFGTNEPVELQGVVYGRYRNALMSKSGDLWLVSLMTNKSGLDWYRGVGRFNSVEYDHYNEKTPGFGSLGDYHEFLGLEESTDGKIWLGNNGGNIKMWSPETDSWSRYIIKSKWDLADDEKMVYHSTSAFGGGWQKIDGIVQDSLGYMWYSVWSNDQKSGGSPYRVAILNPDNDEYRFALSRRPDEDNFNTKSVFHPYKSAVLSNGDRIFAEPSGGEYIVVPGTVNPFSDNVDSLAVIGKNVPNINQIVAAENGGVAIVASAAGLSLIRTDVDSVSDGGITINGEGFEAHALDYEKPISSVAIESCDIQQGGSYNTQRMDSIVTTTFWASVSEVGVERFVLREYIKNRVSTAELQLNSNPVIVSSEHRRYLKGNATLAIDKVRNHLWIAGEQGLARYQLGYSVENSSGDSDEYLNRVYPNPYSKSNHSVVTIDNLSPNSYIDIYTLSGTLIAHFDSNNSEGFSNSGAGKIFTWTPSSGFAPGTYLVAMKDSDTGITEIKKVVIVP